MRSSWKIKWITMLLSVVFLCPIACKKQSGTVAAPDPVIQPSPLIPPSILNETHLTNLAVKVNFSNGDQADGIYIYANAPLYAPVTATDEGFTCVDDVARVALFYARSNAFNTDMLVQNKVYGLLRFIINMQSDNGYFYNFLQPGNTINKTGVTSINQPKWWSWRALQAITEISPLIRPKNPALANRADASVLLLINAIKQKQVNLPLNTIAVNGIDVPQWLPEGADQAATLILGLIPYCKQTNDAIIKTYIQKLANGIVLTQAGDSTHFPYGCFLSSGNTWHAYGSDMALALFKAGAFLPGNGYSEKALSEVSHFYPWLLTNGLRNSFDVSLVNGIYTKENEKQYEQIAYGIRPLVFAAIEAYLFTGNEKYADIAGHLAAWFLGSNTATTAMFSVSTGRCFDGISDGNLVNKNSGAESTIEALLTMQLVSAYPSVKAAMDKYKL